MKCTNAWKLGLLQLEQGTGIVHCAPSHGPDDFNLCLKNGIIPSLIYC